MAVTISLVLFIFVFFVSQLIFVNCGPCKTPTSKEGECIDIDNCDALLALHNNITSLDNETRKFLHKSQCGFDGLTPKVCCQKDDNDGSTNRVHHSAEPSSSNHTNVVSFGNRQAEEETTKLDCGIQYTANRIYDGTITEIDEFPWMALLIYMTEKGPGLACGGVLLNKNYVLTAAHCVTGPHVQKLGKLVGVRLGEYDLNSAIDCDDTIETEEYCAPPAIDYYIETSHPHPDYKPDTADRYHDIALLKLKNAVNFTKFVQPICLPTVKHYNAIKKSKELMICGWGKTEKAEGSSIKLKAKVPLVEQNECKNPYEAKGIRIAATTQLCAGDGKHDSCKGDSGGPLMLEDMSDPIEARWFVLGVISFGSNPCAKQGVPAVYTKVLPYVEWIKSTMKS